MENTTDTKPNAIIEIVPDGDLVLIVGPKGTKLRVCSVLLMAASKPFSVMLGPDWKEGHNMRDQHEPFELPLPDDNAAALKIICSIIHHQNTKVSRTLPTCVVLAVAIAADKYDCVNTLKFASETWLRPSGDEPGSLIRLTVATYLFRNAQAFREITRALILTYDSAYLTLYTKDLESIMPWKVLCLLEEQRGLARLEVSQILIAGGATSSYCHRCGSTSKYAYAYMKLLETKNLWPANVFLISISRVLEKAETMPDPVPEERDTQCQYECKHEPPAYREDRRWKLDSFSRKIGLCLHCILLGRMDSKCSDPSHSI